MNYIKDEPYEVYLEILRDKKVDKKIEIQTKKLKLAQNLKQDTKNAKTELMKKAPAKKETKVEESTNVEEIEEVINQEETIIAGTDAQ